MNKADTRLVALAFFFGAILLRFLPHWHNFTPVAAMALFAGCYLSGRSGIILAFGAIALSDFVGNALGIPGIHYYNPATMLTVYLALAMVAVVGRTMQGRVSFASVPMGALAATSIFFLTTNFACWLDPLMAYPRTATGLIQCYVAAIPFALNTLLGDLFYAALLFGGYAFFLNSNRAVASQQSPPAM